MQNKEQGLGIGEILYYIGGGIVFLGIVILIQQNWDMLSFSVKLLATLGAGIAAYIIGLLFSRHEKTEPVGTPFYLISALVMPIGLYVLFNHGRYNADSSGLQALTSAILLGIYFASYFAFKKNIFALFSIIFGTWLFYSLTAFIGSNNLYVDSSQFYQYLTLAAGLVYILLGYAFKTSSRAPLSGFLYSFGIFGFLAAALALGSWHPQQNIFWELIFPVLAFGAIFFSVYVKNKWFLVWGTIFLMIYILKITAEYFSGSLGWPLALVVAGLLMIGIGYLSVSINKKYLNLN